MKCKSCSSTMTLTSGPHMPKIAIYTCECGALVKQGLTHDVGTTWIMPTGKIETNRACNPVSYTHLTLPTIGYV